MIRKIKDIILRIIYILITVYLLIFIPSFWGHKPLVVISGSMEPVLKVGGILYYHEEKIENLKENEILVYELNEHIISHRIVEKNDDTFLTKGDANQSVDTYFVNKNQVLGKGTDWSIPYLGYYADFIYHHKYLLFISIGIIIIDLFYDFNKSKKNKEGDSQNEKDC